MPLVVALDDIKPDHIIRRSGADVPPGITTTFIRAAGNELRTPTAIQAHYDPGSKSSAHFHSADQFQILVDGKGKFGRHDVAPYYVHFSRAYTPYGPLHADKDIGWTFVTLRTRRDGGAQRLPAAQDTLKGIQGRRPWQITSKVTFPSPGAGANLQPIPDIQDDQGLYAGSLTVAPHMQTVAPSPAGGEGQYVLVVKGSLFHDGKEHKALTLVFVKPEEEAVQLRAGEQGLQAIIMNFPKVTPQGADAKTPSVRAEQGKWQCTLCDFVYAEAIGLLEDGIPAGTPWAKVPETWTCPDCGAGKTDFERA